MDRNYRVRTSIGSDTVLNVNMRQDFDFLEVLTLRLRQRDSYRLHSSNYGVIVGRVLANDAFGIPNAKVSVFIERDGEDTRTLESLYPYAEVNGKDSDGRRYNLLPDYSDDDCYRVVGTFPNKRLMLDDDSQLEVFDRYWKYTTVSNNAGDYMIFGVPSGSQQLHVDIDLSDIGVLSQKPRDMSYKGYNMTLFDSSTQFKESTNLDSLAQLYSQNKSVFVYPFWGDSDNGVASITRCDVQVDYKFEPTCVFMGSIVSDNDSNAIGHKCAPSEGNGMNPQLIAGEGTIEMIRKTQDGLVEEFQINGNQLIDSDGVWCYQIPMNLDFVGTDEYGNIVPTDNPSKGIPTRTQVRFRFSKTETGDEGFSRHTAKYLVPMNPIFDETKVEPTVNLNKDEFDRMYAFGSATPQSCFRDLYWNNVYSVKNHIPKAQVAHRINSDEYTALKGANLVDAQNPIPFNKLRIDMPFVYIVVCILFNIVLIIVQVINVVISGINAPFKLLNGLFGKLPFGIGKHLHIDYVGCVPLGGNINGDNTAFYPSCANTYMNASSCPQGMEGCKKSANPGKLLDIVQEKLALEYKIVKLDFYQDWLNGCLYMPLWHWRKRKKKKFLFFTLSRAKNEFCDCEVEYSRLKTYTNCNIVYSDDSLKVTSNDVPEGEDDWHKARSAMVKFKNGLIKGVENKDGLTVYYYVAAQPTADNTEVQKENGGFKVMRLYATDIILLGNLNEENIYGIPQFFKALPSTTANVPPVSTVEEEDSTEEEKKNDNFSETENGVTVTTGMVWRDHGDEDVPMYKRGLFMNLTCTYADTKAKSCINVERLSELGVSLDSSYYMSYAYHSNGMQKGYIDSDGFITKYELDDMENRAMFATMNHIGFVPQSYQDSISGYTTQVEDDKTNYLIPKFKYLYPVDFDGRVQVMLERYKKGFAQSMIDGADEAYITFRLGATSSKDRNVGEYNRKRHFYKYSGGKYQMPAYNNSFYFYFGINKGSTAIDKFNNLYFAECVKNKKFPFSIDVSSRGLSYCPGIYKGKNGYAYIRVSSDDIQTPYSYTLYDSLGMEVVSEEGMTEKSFVIGGTESNNVITANPAVKYQLSADKVENRYGSDGLTNQAYTIELADANGKRLSERVVLNTDMMSFDFETRKLGTKFYDTDSTPMSFICDKSDNYYGVIEIKRVMIDSYEFVINSVTSSAIADGALIINANCSALSSDMFSKSTDVVITITPMSTDDEIGNCLCNIAGDSYAPTVTLARVTEDDGKTRNHIQVNVYQPMSYSVMLTQMCDGKQILENQSSQVVSVNNGDNFNTSLNGMPVRFMLGSINDTPNASVANKSSFYSSAASTTVLSGKTISPDIIGWFGVHQEPTYRFGADLSNSTSITNKGVWDDFVTLGGSIDTIAARTTILKYKLSSMFSLSSVVYATPSSEDMFSYSYSGGVEPILVRYVAPNYSDENAMGKQYTYVDGSDIALNADYPNIVGFNYKGDNKDSKAPSPRFNGLWWDNKGKSAIGNYFAAFTKNGRYTSSTTGTCGTNIMSIPNYSAVNVNGSGWKKIGKDITMSTVPTRVYNSANDSACNSRKSQPYLRALTVDRTLDYDIELWAPSNATSFRLHEDYNKEKVWRSARIRGTIYGGIEMSFDEDYNIISADSKSMTDDDGNTVVTAYTPNKRLEYSYSADTTPNGNAITVYNIPEPSRVAWGKDILLYPSILLSNGTDSLIRTLYGEDKSGEVDDSRQMMKTLFEAEFNGIDIRNLFWSVFNKRLLSEYCKSPINHIVSGTSLVYVYDHSSDADSSLYNGDFNTESLKYDAPANYPTKRYIDVGNIPRMGSYALTLTSCAYPGNVNVSEDGVISAATSQGDSVNFDFTFDDPFEFISDSEDQVMTNMYMMQAATPANNDGYIPFRAKYATLSFRFSSPQTSNGNMVAYAPRLIKVLSSDFRDGGKYNTDGLTYIKTASNGVYGTKASTTERIKDACIDTSYFKQLRNIRFPRRITKDVFPPDNVTVRDGLYYNSDSDKFVTDSDPEYTKIVFKREKIDLGDAKVFTLMVRKETLSDSGSTHTRHMMTHEASSMFDARDVLLKISTDTADTFETSETIMTVNDAGEEVEETVKTQTITFLIKNNVSYVWCTTASTEGSGYEYFYDMNAYNAYVSENSGTTGLSIGDANVKTVSGGPINYSNQAFTDENSLGFTFVFRDRRGNTYSVDGEDNTPDSDGITFVRKIKVVFSGDMGSLSDTDKWGNKPTFEIYGRTSSGFTYGLFKQKGSSGTTGIVISRDAGGRLAIAGL